MPNKHHLYKITTTWTGNKGEGTSNYKSYERAHNIEAGNKSIIESSSDPAFMGDPTKYNPEELFLAALSSCHMLWFLHLCATAGIVVEEYTDNAEGLMKEEIDGAGQFTSVTLHPHVVVKRKEMIGGIDDIHHKAHEMCFIARSVNFKVFCQGRCTSM